MLHIDQTLTIGATERPIARTIPMVLLVFVCFALLRLSVFHPTVLVGNDLFWHLAYGNSILDHHALPTADWLSWTFKDQPYQITQWLGEVLLALAVRFGGSTLLSMTLTVASVLTLYCAWRAAALYIRNPVTALFLALLTVLPVLTLNARPQIFGMLAFAALVWALSVWFERKDPRALVAMPAIMVLWVNLHGSFIVGVLYIAALGGGAWIVTFLEMKHKFVASVRAHLPLALASFAAIFAVLINPYGWHAFEYVIKISHLQSTAPGAIREWDSTSLTTDHGFSFIAIVLLVFATIALKKERPTVQMVLAFLSTVYFGLQADRQSLLALIALVPIFGQALMGSWFESEIDRNLNAVVKLWKAGVIILFVGCGAMLLHSASIRYIEDSFERMYPKKLLDYLDKNHIEGKLFNSVEHGGYIASRGRLVFLDGRLDLYGDPFFYGTGLTIRGEAGWREFLAKYKPDLFILDNKNVLIELLMKSDKCQSLYSDQYHSALKCV